VQDGEAVSVRTFEPARFSHERKLEIAGELRKYFAEVDASRHRLSDEEAETIITEAMRSVRPGASRFECRLIEPPLSEWDLPASF